MHEPINESCSNQKTSQRMLQTNSSASNILTTLLSNTFQPTCSGTSNRISELSRIEATLENITKNSKTFQHHGSQNDSTESSSLSPIETPLSSTTNSNPTTALNNNPELQRKIDFNQFIKDRIQERILKRKVLKAKLLKLNNMRTVLERLLSNHHQNLYYMGLKLDEEEMFERKLNSLDDESREKASFYHAQIKDLRSQMNDVMTEIKVTFVEFNKL